MGILGDKDVITFSENAPDWSNETFRTKELLNRLLELINTNNHKLVAPILQGVPCEVLSPNTEWVHGKLYIKFEFIPDIPDNEVNNAIGIY